MIMKSNDIKLDGFNLPVIKENGDYWCPFLRLYCISKSNWNPNIYPCIDSIGKEFFIVVENNHDKRRKDWYINSKGITRFFALSRSIPITKIKSIINTLNNYGFTVRLEKTSKESDFAIDMENIFSVLGIKIERQKSFELSYGFAFVDFILNNKLIIEYDEDAHKNYDSLKEKKREAELTEKGFCFLRVTDEKSNSENIAIILQKLKDLEGL